MSGWSDGPDVVVMSDDDTEETEHLSDVPDGCGCVELWEHTSERREEG